MTSFLVSYSGGLVSWAAAKRTAERYGRDRVRLLFADTLIEDADLYRFLVEGAANIFGVAITNELLWMADSIPDVEDDPDCAARKELLPELARRASKELPGLHWIMDGRTPFEVFADERFIGNSQRDPCSKILKRQLMDRWRDNHCRNWETVLVFGLDWSERGRIEGHWEKGKWKPGHRERMEAIGWRALYPMDERPYLTTADIQADLATEGIRGPRLYDLGFPHNNCGGFCCKMGHKQATHLNAVLPRRYGWCESKEQSAIEAIGPTAKPMLRYRSKGATRSVSLRQFRLNLEQQPTMFDDHGWGCGGGCAIDDEPEPAEVAS